MALDLSFAAIASVYDAQRAHPPEASAQIGRALVSLVGQGAPILELGVGTGRIAIPTAVAGGFVVGLDVSPEMLAVAAERAAAVDAPLKLLRGDAQALPFAAGAFRAALAVHVLHLLPDWRVALAEIVRVLGPGGLFVQGSDWRDPDSCVGLLRGRLRIAAVELLPGSRPPGAGAAIAQALVRLGGVTSGAATVARWTRLVSPEEVIAGMAARVDSETWAMPDEQLAAVVAMVRAWAVEQWGDLSEPQEVEHRFVFTSTRFAGQMVDSART